MDNVLLGRKLKEARLAKKMTQSEVVGDFITRNMLSQIESGVATPSIKTLEYLSSVLKIPLKSLLEEDDKTKEKKPSFLEVFLDAKKHYQNGEYERTIKKLFGDERLLEPLQDEVAALAARAYLALAKKQLGKGKPTAAIRSAQLALHYAQEGIYASEDIEDRAIRFINKTTAERRKRV